MIKIDYMTNRFYNLKDQEFRVKAGRKGYDELTAELGTLGLQVYVHRIIVRDGAVVPHNFSSQAIHRYVFPVQEESELIADKSGTLEVGVDHRTRLEHTEYSYRPGLARAYIRIAYDDARGCIAFSATDMLNGKSIVDDEVDQAIEKMRLAVMDPAVGDMAEASTKQR